MAKLIFTTCEAWPNLSASDQLVATALESFGHVVEAVPWASDFDRFQQADVIVLRAHWDYHHKLAAFEAWLDQVTAQRIPLYNSVELVRWNLRKSYLLDLQARGITIPISYLLRVDETPEPVYRQQGWSSAVIKPVAGASGHLVDRVDMADLPDWAACRRTQRPQAEWLIQEFRPEIQQQGELSLIFINGQFSHAVAKHPQPGEFRVNSQYQGQIERIEPTDTVRTQARQALLVLTEIPLYARIDGIVTQDNTFYLLELEFNEPGLYFQYVPEKAPALAEAIHAKVVAVPRTRAA